MKMVNRLISITEGDITIDGTSVRSLDLTELRRGIGYVIQQVGLFPHLSVGDNIGTVPKLLGWPKKRIRARAAGAARARRPRGGRRQALSRPALRRPAAARRPRARARGQPAADADGRAVRRDRPDHARAPAGRVPAPAPRVPQDGDLRHARHRRGDQDGRPHRDPPSRAASSRSTTRRTRSSRNPANDFVERFVGADRGLKRLVAAPPARRRARACERGGIRRAALPGVDDAARRALADAHRRAHTKSSSSATTASRSGCSRCSA